VQNYHDHREKYKCYLDMVVDIFPGDRLG